MSEILQLADAQCCEMWNNLGLGYTETKGLPAFRKECSLEYEGFDEDNILCFAGAEEGIFCTWVLDIDALKSAIIVGETKLLVMNFPHNPTGAVLTYPEQLEVVKLAKSFDIWIFSDEVYKGFELIDDADSEFFPSTKDF
eukprot:gene26770-35088_t